MSQRKKPKPKRIFRERRMPPEVSRLIDDITRDCPELRGLIVEMVHVFQDPMFLRIFYGSGRYERAGLLLAWRDAAGCLKEGRKCDHCDETAKFIRFECAERKDLPGVDLPKKATVLAGFAVVCPSCMAKPDGELKRQMVGEYAEYREKNGGHDHRRPAIIGPRVGEAGSLPKRHSLQECDECKSMCWIDRDESDPASGDDPMYLCFGCARVRYDDGRLEGVPAELLGVKAS